MKLKFNLQKKEASLDVGVEDIVKKQIDINAKKPPKKTRYQIKQEEKRKNEELKHKQSMQILLAAGVFLGVIFVICFIGAALS